MLTVKNVSGESPLVTGQDVWFPDGTVCQSDKSLTSFCVEGRCEPFLCPSPAEGLQSEEGYPSLEEGRPSSAPGDNYPFLLHPALCQIAPSFIPGRPAIDKVPNICPTNDDFENSISVENLIFWEERKIRSIGLREREKSYFNCQNTIKNVVVGYGFLAVCTASGVDKMAAGRAM
jgi:hypothetical protein